MPVAAISPLAFNSACTAWLASLRMARPAVSRRVASRWFCGSAAQCAAAVIATAFPGTSVVAALSISNVPDTSPRSSAAVTAFI